MLIVIEHLEPVLSRWLLIEYRHAYEIAGERLLIANVCGEDAKTLARTVGVKTTCKSVADLYEVAVVLDPSAEVLLSPDDKELSDVFIVGGILGDHPPRGRTRELITKRMKGPVPRSLGEGQYSIDGAVYVTYKVIFEGIPLKDIPYVDGLRVVSRRGLMEHEIYLPYRYPLVNGKPLVHPDHLRYLKGNIVLDEVRLLKGV